MLGSASTSIPWELRACPRHRSSPPRYSALRNDFAIFICSITSVGVAIFQAVVVFWCRCKRHGLTWAGREGARTLRSKLGCSFFLLPSVPFATWLLTARQLMQKAVCTRTSRTFRPARCRVDSPLDLSFLLIFFSGTMIPDRDKSPAPAHQGSAIAFVRTQCSEKMKAFRVTMRSATICRHLVRS